MKITNFNTDTNYTFRINNNKSNNLTTDYSALLDDIIANHIIETNPYLKKAKDNALYDAMFAEANSSSIKLSSLKDIDLFDISAKYLAKYGKINKLPYILGHTYYFDGIPTIFHIDSIEINGIEYYYDDFDNISNISFPKKNQKLIIDIYTKGNTKININL